MVASTDGPPTKGGPPQSLTFFSLQGASQQNTEDKRCVGSRMKIEMNHRLLKAVLHITASARFGKFGNGSLKNGNNDRRDERMFCEQKLQKTRSLGIFVNDHCKKFKLNSRIKLECVCLQACVHVLLCRKKKDWKRTYLSGHPSHSRPRQDFRILSTVLQTATKIDWHWQMTRNLFAIYNFESRRRSYNNHYFKTSKEN